MNEKRLAEMEAKVLSLDEKLDEVTKPMRQSLSIADMKAAKSYQPISKKKFYEKVEELNIEEPIEELIQMLD